MHTNVMCGGEFHFTDLLQCRSQCPRGQRRGSAGAPFLGLRIRIRPGEMNVCLLWVLCDDRQSCLRRADHLSRGILPIMVCLSVIVEPRQGGYLGSTRAVKAGKRKIFYNIKQILNIKIRACKRDI